MKSKQHQHPQGRRESVPEKQLAKSQANLGCQRAKQKSLTSHGARHAKSQVEENTQGPRPRRAPTTRR